jgi:hypothetical protein
MPALGPGVLADARVGVARALAGLALAFDAALARLEDVRIRVRGTVAEGGREAELVGDRRARLAVPDLLLHDQALTGGITDRGDHLEVDLKSMGQFPFDPV